MASFQEIFEGETPEQRKKRLHKESQTIIGKDKESIIKNVQ
ncbi:39_t:CDS:2 [Rhizophagus irregularis]|nr:39_t:CDS:2 [Rhizophagus irregularis]